MNSFGSRFRFTTFGESHGRAVGCIVEGVPAGLRLEEEFLQSELDRRKPGQNSSMTQRKEDDRVEILSGVFEGVCTGTPIAFVIYNKDQKSRDYGDIKDLFRPGHADIAYFMKYGLRDYRGGGRSSARESAARVCAGALAKLILKEVGVSVLSGVYSIGGIEAKNIDFEYAKKSEICSLDSSIEPSQKALIDAVKKEGDSIGGSVLVKVKNTPPGLGEPMYGKLDAKIGELFMGLNGVKGLEIGLGCSASSKKGSEDNDPIRKDGFSSNSAGGILGGISSGEDIDIKVYFKPTPSIYQTQKSIDIDGNEVEFSLRGRHDPCIAIRGSVVAESQAAIVVADALLSDIGRRMSDFKKVYEDRSSFEDFFRSDKQ